MQDMDPRHSDNMTSMNLNLYPSTEGHLFPEGAQRIWSHTDYEALTLLFQQPGILLETMDAPVGLMHLATDKVWIL